MPPENKTENRPIQTYAEDMAEAIHESGGAIIKKVIHEQEAKEAEDRNLNPESKRNKLFLVFSILLFLITIGIIFAVINLRQKIGTVSVEEQFHPFIFLDKTDFIEVDYLDKDRIATSSIRRVDATEVKLGGVEGIYLTENQQVVGLKDFLRLIEGNFPAAGAELVDDNFLMGAANTDTKDLFILLKVRSFVDILPIMRTWEEKLFQDLHGFFGFELTPDTSYLLTKDFEDGIIANKNARILYEDNGALAIAYVFMDDHHVLLANTPGAAREIATRLTASGVRK